MARRFLFNLACRPFFGYYGRTDAKCQAPFKQVKNQTHKTTINFIRLASSTSSSEGGRIFSSGPTVKGKAPKVKKTDSLHRLKMEWPTITFFGDSITRRSHDPDNGCWASHVAHRVADYFQVDVRGFDGYNSGWGYDLMPKLFPKSYLDRVEIFVPFFGHNDSWDEKWAPLHVPVVHYEKNMRNILQYLHDNGVDGSKIILITPTWYDKNSVEQGVLPVSKTLENQLKYREVIERIAKEKGIDLLDFMDISMKHEPFAELFSDGVHLTRLGAKLFFDSLMPIIEKKILAKFGKPIEDLRHSFSIHEHPDVLAWRKKSIDLE